MNAMNDSINGYSPKTILPSILPLKNCKIIATFVNLGITVGQTVSVSVKYYNQISTYGIGGLTKHT